MVGRVKNILATRYIQGIKDNVEISNNESKFITTISPDNRIRKQVNDSCLNKISASLPVFKLPAIIKGANKRQLAQIYQLSDDKTSRLPSILYIYQGMPIKFRSNQCVPAMLANGTRATIFYIQWKPDTTFQTNGSFLIPNKLPINIFIQIDDSNIPPIKFPNLPAEWPANIMPIRKETRKITYFKNNTNSISIHTYPIIPAFAVTTHLVQGLTIPSLIVTEPLPKNQRPDKHILYVSISRCPTRYGILLSLKLTERHFKYFTPHNDTIKEDERLKTLDEILYVQFLKVTSTKIDDVTFKPIFIATCERNVPFSNTALPFDLSHSPLDSELSDDEETLETLYSSAKENARELRHTHLAPRSTIAEISNPIS